MPSQQNLCSYDTQQKEQLGDPWLSTYLDSSVKLVFFWLTLPPRCTADYIFKLLEVKASYLSSGTSTLSKCLLVRSKSKSESQIYQEADEGSALSSCGSSHGVITFQSKSLSAVLEVGIWELAWLRSARRAARISYGKAKEYFMVWLA